MPDQAHTAPYQGSALFTLPCYTQRILHPLSFHMKFMKQAFGQFHKLHGLSMFAFKAKIYGVLYKQYSSIAFDETTSYWSAPKNS